ncbi:MAG: hypothetical protein WBV73_06705 [Phormidium sp.]
MVFPQKNQLEIVRTSIVNLVNRRLVFVKDAVVTSFVPEVNCVSKYAWRSSYQTHRQLMITAGDFFDIVEFQTK